MRDYQKHQRERLPLVKTLFGLGLTIEEISQITKWSKAVIGQDVRLRLGGEVTFPNRPKEKVAVFSAVLKQYAKLVTSENQGVISPNGLREALADWLPEKEFLSVILGIEYTMDHLTQPSFPEEKMPYRQLMAGIFFHPFPPRPPQTKTWWHQILKKIAHGEVETPRNKTRLCYMLVQVASDMYRNEIMPIWDDEVFKLVDGLLNTLSERELMFIRQKYGLHGEESHSLEEIADLWGHSRERLRQIEAKAMQKLRARARPLKHLVQPVGNALQRELERKRQEKEEAELASMHAYNETALRHLREKTQDLEFTVRTLNCLASAKLEYVGQLVQKSETELLKTKNFGRKSLLEIREVLAVMNLTLNMTEQEPVVARFNAYFRSL